MTRSARASLRTFGIVAIAALLAAPAVARDTLGVFAGWGAYRDPARCFAIAEPEQRRRGAWRPFAAVGTWPARGVHGQLHIRLRSMKKPGAPAWLTVNERRFRLAAGKADAWAPDARADAAIVAAMRQGGVMLVETLGVDDRAFADRYPLRGAATAIDAAALGCARRR